MAEEVVLPAPIVTSKTQEKWKLSEFTMGRDLVSGSPFVRVIVRGDNPGEVVVANYPTPSPNAQPSGQTLINNINTADLRTNSLIKRIFTRLIADGYIAGTVTGTPE